MVAEVVACLLPYICRLSPPFLDLLLNLLNIYSYIKHNDMVN